MEEKRYHRRVIPISAFDSPNVKLALLQQQRGFEVTGQRVLKGVLSWDQLQHRLATWDEVQLCIGVHGKFYAGAVLLLFPPARLNAANDLYRKINLREQKAVAIGMDPAEGGDNSAWSVVGRQGLLELVSLKTPDTDVICGMTMELMRRWNVDPERVCFDAGGGKVHADRLRKMGYNVRTVAFGSAPTPPLKRTRAQFPERVEAQEIAYAYKNRRAQMYHEASMLLDPKQYEGGFFIPDASNGEQYKELRRQLSVMPKLTDEEGRYWMLPKDKKDPDSKIKTLKELLGRSPDEADSLVLAVHGMMHQAVKSQAGAVP